MYYASGLAFCGTSRCQQSAFPTMASWRFCSHFHHYPVVRWHAFHRAAVPLLLLHLAVGLLSALRHIHEVMPSVHD